MRLLQLPRSVRNPLSALGALIALIGTLVGGVLLVVHYLEPHHNPYFGIFLFLIVPVFVVAGLVLMPLGAWRQRRRRLRGEGQAESEWPVVDLNRPTHRNVLAIFTVGTAVMLVLSAV